jgi:hypothetical protein
VADLGPIDLQKALKGADHPAHRDGLVPVAKGNGADDTLVKKPAQTGTEHLGGPAEVQKAVFGNE